MNKTEQYAVRYGVDEFVVLNVGSDPDSFAHNDRSRYEKMR